MLGVKYFKTCADLGPCPQFLMFKVPKLKVYENSTEPHQIIIHKKLKEERKDLAKIEKEHLGKKSKCFTVARNGRKRVFSWTLKR